MSPPGRARLSGAALWGCVLRAPGSVSLHSRGAAQSASRARARGLGKARGSQGASSLGKVGYRASSGTGSPCGTGTDPLKRAGKGTGPRLPTVIGALGAGAGRYPEEAWHNPALQRSGKKGHGFLFLVLSFKTDRSADERLRIKGRTTAPANLNELWITTQSLLGAD